MKIEDYSYLQEGGEEGGGEEGDQDGGGFRTMLGLQKKNADSREKALQQVEEQGLARVRNAGPVRRAAVATIVNAREFGKNAKEKAKSGVSGATSFAQGTAALAAAKAAAAASVAVSAPSQLASTAAALYLPPKSVTDLINERHFIDINYNDLTKATRFETDFKSELSDLVVKFFTVSDYTPSFEFSKIKVLNKLSSIKLYHTKLCLTEIFAALKTCNAYLFQSPLPDQPTPKAAIKQFKDKIQNVVEANFKDDFFKDNIAIYISNNRYLSLQENLNNYLFIDKNSNDYSITNLHEKSIFLYILQLFVIYYYPKYLLEIICKVMVENVTAISEGIDALMNDGNLNNKLSELVASLVSESKKADALRGGGQRGGVGPDDPGIIKAIADKHAAIEEEKLSNDRIKQLVFDKYIKGADLQDEYNKKSRKVFYNALVNFAISIILDITRNNYTREIIKKLAEFSKTSLDIKDNMNAEIALIDTQIRDLDLASKISAQVQLIEGPPGTRLTRDALFDKYYAATTQDNEKKNIRGKILNTTSTNPIYVEFQKLERFKGELEIMEKKKNTYERINEVKRNMFKINNILEIKDDIWLGRGTSTPGDNYHDALYDLIMTAAEQSSMFSLNGPEVPLVPLDLLPVLTQKPTIDTGVIDGRRFGPARRLAGPDPLDAEFSGPTVDRDSLDPRVVTQLDKTDNLLRKTVDEAHFKHLNTKIIELEAEIRELEEELKKAPTDSSIKAADVQEKLLTRKDDLVEAKQKLAAADAAAADADANDAAANAAPPAAFAFAAPPPPLAAPVPVPDAAANAGANAAAPPALSPPPATLSEGVTSFLQNLLPKLDPAEAAKAEAAKAEAAKAKAADDAQYAARMARARKSAENNRAAEAAAAKEAELQRLRAGDAPSPFGGKRRTRRHKKRAGTRRYKKRAGTRRHKKRSGTHKKRKNRTR